MGSQSGNVLNLYSVGSIVLVYGEHENPYG